MHFFKKIVEFAGRCLKVIFNPIKKIVVTAYFVLKHKQDFFPVFKQVEQSVWGLETFTTT